MINIIVIILYISRAISNLLAGCFLLDFSMSIIFDRRIERSIDATAVYTVQYVLTYLNKGSDDAEKVRQDPFLEECRWKRIEGNIIKASHSRLQVY